MPERDNGSAIRPDADGAIHPDDVQAAGSRPSNREANRRTRERLRQALLALLEKKPLDAITITELARKAGVSHMAFYRNYKSKTDILQEVADAITGELNRLYRESRCVTGAREWLIDVFRWAKERQAALRTIAGAHIPAEFNLQSMLRCLAPESRGKPFYANLALEGAFTFFLGGWLERGAQESPEEMADIFLSFWNTRPAES